MNEFEVGDKVEYHRFDRWAVHPEGFIGEVIGRGREHIDVMNIDVMWENGKRGLSSIQYLKLLSKGDPYEDMLI